MGLADLHRSPLDSHDLIARLQSRDATSDAYRSAPFWIADACPVSNWTATLCRFDFTHFSVPAQGEGQEKFWIL